MRVVSGRDPVLVRVPMYGAGADIVDGALIEPGVTADTNIGFFIKSAAAGLDAIGVLRGIHDYSVVGDSLVAGTAWVWGEVELCDQYSPLWVEYDQADTVAASTVTTALTITSLTADIDTTWFFSTNGSGTGALHYAVSTASGVGVLKTAPATAWSATTVIKILRLGHQLAKLNTNQDKIGTDGADGSWTCFVLENWFQANGYPLQQLNPTKHDALVLTGARFFAKVLARNTAGHTVD